ncbi:MAG: tyrosine-type recombinase/integrase [Lachnospirales bacterium]
MAGKRKDNKGRNLRTGEYYDSKNKRYMFRKMIDGERISITATDLVELRAQENELLCRIDKGNKLNTRDAKMPLNSYFDFWMETFARSGRKATTCTNYKSYYNTYIKNTIGKKPIGKVTKVDCQKIINDMIASGKKHSTMSNLKSCLNLLFECAVDDDVILKNPAKNLQIPQTESKKRKAIEQNQIDVFMEYVKHKKEYAYAYPAFVILFNLGLRIGEMAALTWNDIDFKQNTITINKTLNRYRKVDYGFTMGIASPKSKTSNRTIYMNSVVKTTLLKLKMSSVAVQGEKLPYVDDSGHKRGEVSGFVFYNSIGHVWNEPSFRELIKRIVKRINRDAEKNGTAQIENFCPHMARHTYTSLAYSAGADVKIVSQILGHASTSVTLDTYTHLTEDKQKEQENIARTVKIS